MSAAKRPEADLKLFYRKALELGLIGALVLMLVLFHALPQIGSAPKTLGARDIQIEVADIPLTEQIKKAPPPPRPSIPIPTESEEIPEDFTIESTELDLSEIPPPPAPSNSDEDPYDSYIFIPFDEPPRPIGGLAAIVANLVYPPIARKAGIEARVVVGVLVDESGRSIKTQILTSSGSTAGFDEAAAAAIMAVKWKPAMQRDKPVKVWVAIPVRFSLKDAEGTT